MGVNGREKELISRRKAVSSGLHETQENIGADVPERRAGSSLECPQDMACSIRACRSKGLKGLGRTPEIPATTNSWTAG